MLRKAVKKAFNVVGLDVSRTSALPQLEATFDQNQVVPNIWKRPAYLDLIPLRFSPGEEEIVLLGDREEIERLGNTFQRQGFKVQTITWDWTHQPPAVQDGPRIILCRIPVDVAQWEIVRKLKQQFGARLIGLQEVVLPFTTIREAQASFEYYLKTLEEIAPVYRGDEFFGPLDKLNALLPLAGKSIIEFGPMEGGQTAGLVRLGAGSVTCIEARAESLIKTLVAKEAFNWHNVRLVMDDFHNADDLKYGKFDLAFAHGVYYHSIAPFFFFENLLSLSNNVFLGGYTYDDSRPQANDSFQTLEYEGRKYRVKLIPMGRSYNTGVNLYGYHFSGPDLQSFFKNRGCRVHVISEEESGDPWGDRFLRFLATR